MNDPDFDIKGFLYEYLERLGYKFVSPIGFHSYAEENFLPIYTKDLKVNVGTIYGTSTKLDMIYHPEKHPKCLIIDTIYQATSGSVDTKYPYFVANIKNVYPHRTIILIDGEGYKKQALAWLKNQVNDKLLQVLSVDEFKEWAKQGNL